MHLLCFTLSHPLSYLKFCVLPKCPPQLGLGLAKARSQELNLDLFSGWQVPNNKLNCTRKQSLDCGTRYGCSKQRLNHCAKHLLPHSHLKDALVLKVIQWQKVNLRL